MGRPDLEADAGLSRLQGRIARIEEVTDEIAKWTGTLTRDQVAARCHEQGVPASPLRDVLEVLQDPHLHARGFLSYHESPSGRIALPNVQRARRFRSRDPFRRRRNSASTRTRCSLSLQRRRGGAGRSAERARSETGPRRALGQNDRRRRSAARHSACIRAAHGGSSICFRSLPPGAIARASSKASVPSALAACCGRAPPKPRSSLSTGSVRATACCCSVGMAPNGSSISGPAYASEQCLRSPTPGGARERSPMPSSGFSRRLCSRMRRGRRSCHRLPSERPGARRSARTSIRMSRSKHPRRECARCDHLYVRRTGGQGGRVLTAPDCRQKCCSSHDGCRSRVRIRQVTCTPGRFPSAGSRSFGRPAPMCFSPTGRFDPGGRSTYRALSHHR